MAYDFSTLPYETQFNYLLYLPVTDIANYCSVNPHVANICTDDYFWQQKMDHDFPEISQYKPEDITYQQELFDLISMSPNTGAEKGRWDVLLYLESQGKLPDHDGYVAAIKNGYVDVLEWLKSKNINSIPKNRFLVQNNPRVRQEANYAAMYGQVKVLDWLAQQGIFPDEDAIDNAVMYGHINVLEWLEQHEITPQTRPPTIAFNKAVEKGYLDVLKWLAKYNILPNDLGVALAAKKNQIDILEWLSTKGIYPQMSYLDLKYLKPETIQWLKSKNLIK